MTVVFIPIFLAAITLGILLVVRTWPMVTMVLPVIGCGVMLGLIIGAVIYAYKYS